MPMAAFQIYSTELTFRIQLYTGEMGGARSMHGRDINLIPASLSENLKGRSRLGDLGVYASATKNTN